MPAGQDFHGKALELCGNVHGGVDVVELGALAAALRERLEGGVRSKVVFCHNDLQASTWHPSPIFLFFFFFSFYGYVRTRLPAFTICVSWPASGRNC